MQSRTSGLKRESWRKYNKKSSQMDRQNPARLLLVQFVSVVVVAAFFFVFSLVCHIFVNDRCCVIYYKCISSFWSWQVDFGLNFWILDRASRVPLSLYSFFQTSTTDDELILMMFVIKWKAFQPFSYVDCCFMNELQRARLWW